MDQCRSRLKLSENFERHWSIQISGVIHMDQLLVHMNFLGKFVWTNGPEKPSKVSPYTGIGPWMALPSHGCFHSADFVLDTLTTVRPRRLLN